MIRYLGFIILLNVKTLQPYIHPIDEVYSDPNKCMVVIEKIHDFADKGKYADMFIDGYCIAVPVKPPI